YWITAEPDGYFPTEEFAIASPITIALKTDSGWLSINIG
ncbi:unnamed protein product, partial [marine sediment metagenome]